MDPSTNFNRELGEIVPATRDPGTSGIFRRFEGKNPSPESYEETAVVASFGAPKELKSAKPSISWNPDCIEIAPK